MGRQGSGKTPPGERKTATCSILYRSGLVPEELRAIRVSLQAAVASEAGSGRSFRKPRHKMALKRQLVVGTGALGYSDFGNNTVKLQRWAFSVLYHKHMPDTHPMPMEAASREELGVYIFPYVKVAVHRAPTKCVSVSWHAKCQPIYILPEGDTTFTNPPFFFFPYSPGAGGVRIAAIAADKAGPSPPRDWSRIELLEAERTHEGHGLQVRYTRSRSDGLTQYVCVASLPDEATVYCTAFRADRDGEYLVESPFCFTADTIQGFPMHTEQHWGERWLNMSDHIEFVSTATLPAKLPPNRFVAAENRTYAARGGEWFGVLGVVVYARQHHALTRQMADRVHLIANDARKTIALQLESSSRISMLEFPLPN